jgi:acetolactate synthase-1/2/3 large subunit
LIDSLVQNGVEHIFGYPGGAILPIYELYHWEKPTYLNIFWYVTNKVLMQQTYTRATNKVGVCFATSGPEQIS